MGIIGASASGSGLDFATFKDSPKRRKMTGVALYSQSKLVSQSVFLKKINLNWVE
jgi:hypothetical protein